ncbi:hypothetical protein AB0L41_04890 [Amycolatopsis mediterranei]
MSRPPGPAPVVALSGVDRTLPGLLSAGGRFVGARSGTATGRLR